MQLLYIWIKKYACLENANLNFCENPRFEFNENNKKLNIIKNETNISIFPLQKEQFDEPNCIDNISIIVGSNGAGKTSICKFLYDLYFYHAKISNYIIIYKINGKKYITSIISRKSGQKIQKIANLQYYKSKANYGTKKKGISR